MSCGKQLKILASAIAFAVCADAYAYNLAWLNEKAEDGKPTIALPLTGGRNRLYPVGKVEVGE